LYKNCFAITENCLILLFLALSIFKTAWRLPLMQCSFHIGSIILQIVLVQFFLVFWRSALHLMTSWRSVANATSYCSDKHDSLSHWPYPRDVLNVAVSSSRGMNLNDISYELRIISDWTPWFEMKIVNSLTN